ncbi:Neuronal acetylcholine receptor subunit alpha-7 [Holothuria leucospilota]|uniref:Neuronal acetylcholine receptor subunit alpha-7 n=1 Tax=Holothuria leucospilota TaxID=206669 RepID=A0A9Q1CHA1_HOLLE|nr:Neuronal acetylcholine receptor subunit alpha-7 [Holothuria leucospilota]
MVGLRKKIFKLFLRVTITLTASLFIFHGHAFGAEMATPKRLVKDLLSVYGSRNVRPVKDVNKTVEVIFRAKPVWFADFDETSQVLTFTSVNQMRWKDEFLMWKPDDYGGIKEINFGKDQMWFPDITALERLRTGAWTVNMDEPYAKVNYKGEVVYYNVVMLSVYCKMNVKLFPLDVHNCKIIFTPYSFQAKEVSLFYSKDKEAQENLLKKNGVWSVTEVHYKDVEVRHLCCPEPYTEIHYTLVVQRECGFYVLNFGVPSLLISLTTVAVFLLHPESGEKVSLCVNNVLALIIFQQLLAANMPPTGDQTPIVAYYFTVVISIGFLSVLTTTLTLGMYHHDASRPLPDWLRRFLRMESEFRRRPSEIKPNDVHARDKTNGEARPDPNGMIEMGNKAISTRNSAVTVVRHPIVTFPRSVPLDTTESDSSDISYQDEWRNAARRIDKILFCICMTVMLVVLLFSMYFLGRGKKDE